MTIRIPQPVALALGGVVALVAAYVLYKETPPMYRYIFKFEAM